jgi:thymidylate synthase (FAD)
MSHQLVRHRMAAYSQESQRYCDYSKKGFQFLVPPSYVTKDEEGYEVWKYPGLDYFRLMESEYGFYCKARELKVPAEDARRPLGNATKTEVVVTFTLGMWRHFHKMRTLNAHAEWCIKGLGKQVLEHQASILPDVFGDLQKSL